MNALLFDERPIVANPVLAREIGLNEAIVLQQINFWLEVNKMGKISTMVDIGHIIRFRLGMSPIFHILVMKQ